MSDSQENQGWISIHRKILDNPISSKPNYFSVWLYLIINANHKDKEIIWNNEKVTIKRGEFIGSISKIAKHFNISTGSVARIIKYLETERMIERSSNFRFTHWKVINYNQYQKVESKAESKLKAKGKQVETTNNENNGNNENKNKYMVENLFSEFWNLYPNKKGKKKCLEKYAKLVDQHEDIMKGLKYYISDHEERERLNEFTPPYKNPLTFLNGEHWNDEFEYADTTEWIEEDGMYYRINEEGIKVYKGY